MARGKGFNLGNLHFMGGAVSHNQCTTDDDSYYCQFSRIFSTITMAFSLLFIVFLIYYFFKDFIFTKTKKSRR